MVDDDDDDDDDERRWIATIVDCTRLNRQYLVVITDVVIPLRFNDLRCFSVFFVDIVQASVITSKGWLL